MSDVDVRPEELHRAATSITDAGNAWGDAYGRLDASNANASTLFGNDALGAALHGVYDPYAPKVLSYTADCGYALLETAVVLDQVATIYAEVDANGAVQSQRLAATIGQLG